MPPGTVLTLAPGQEPRLSPFWSLHDVVRDGLENRLDLSDRAATDLLAERALALSGLFDPAPVRRIWREHMSGTHNRGYLLWDILMVEAWRRRWL